VLIERREEKKMLSARVQRVTATAAGTFARRGFATAVSDAASGGVKVAAVDFGQPTSAVTVLVKAGSRFQNKEGLANALKNFAFKVRLICVHRCFGCGADFFCVV
jgi:ubiquinol-cytochrome c reductase core subunit 2